MKNYNSPICEIEIFTTPDVITASVFESFASFNRGNLDDKDNIDRIRW